MFQPSTKPRTPRLLVASFPRFLGLGKLHGNQRSRRGLRFRWIWSFFAGKWYGFCRPQEKGAFVTFVVIGSLLVGWRQKWDFFHHSAVLAPSKCNNLFQGKMCLMLHYQHFQNVQSISTCNVHSVPWWEVSDLAVILATCPPRRSRKKTARGGEANFWCPEKSRKGLNSLFFTKPSDGVFSTIMLGFSRSCHKTSQWWTNLSRFDC